MRITFDVKPTEGGWTGRVLDRGNLPIQDPETGAPLRRKIRRPGGGPDDPPWSFPMPPGEEANALPVDAPHFHLCSASKEEVLRESYQKILNRDTNDAAVERFGRYLFAALLGPKLWRKIREAAGDEPLELALRWDAGDPVLNRYPWEMMHDEAGFLAFRPNLSVTRRHDFKGEFNTSVQFPPRVLFVLGTGLDDDRIRPGAEYMSMVRTLHYAGLLGNLQNQLLVQATTERLETAVQRFRPTIVHFICHGWFDESNHPFLELHDKETKSAKRVYPANLLELLRAGDPPIPPPVVILSACLSATVEERSHRGEPGASFAGSLVEADAGIPIVVGMSGQVADQACRLFTQRFYEALLTRRDIAQAVAEGRRAAFKHGGYDPSAEADWAFPTLFLGDRIEPRIRFAPLAWRQKALQAAREFPRHDFPPFCDRLKVLESYDLLLADSEDQKAVFRREQGIQALAYRSEEGSDPEDPGPKYGRTWQLEDLAARAARDGHLAVLCEVKKGSRPPDALIDLLDLLDEALEIAAYHHGLDFDSDDWHWKRVRDIDRHNAGQKPDPKALPPDLRVKWEALPTEVRERWRDDLASVLGRALRHDLARFLESHRANFDEAARKGVKLLLLFDDLDRISDKAVSEFLSGVLENPFGLRKAREDIRVSFVYVRPDKAPAALRPATKAIDEWLGKNGWADFVPLRRFEDGLEQRLAYQRFIFNWKKEDGSRRRLVTVPETTQNKPLISHFFNTLSKFVQGVPSQLTFETAYPIVESFFPIALKEANDEEAFSAEPEADP